MDTWHANRIAVGTHAKAVSEALRRLGKRCSVRWINRQCEPARDVKRLDYYGAFWRWFEALWRANLSGAEFLFEDFLSRVEHLRRANIPAGDWYECVARCEEEHSDAIRVAIRNQDMRMLVKELAEDIVAKRELLLMAQSRLPKTEPVDQAA